MSSDSLGKHPIKRKQNPRLKGQAHPLTCRKFGYFLRKDSKHISEVKTTTKSIV